MYTNGIGEPFAPSRGEQQIEPEKQYLQVLVHPGVLRVCVNLPGFNQTPQCYTTLSILLLLLERVEKLTYGRGLHWKYDIPVHTNHKILP